MLPQDKRLITKLTPNYVRSLEGQLRRQASQLVRLQSLEHENDVLKRELKMLSREVVRTGPIADENKTLQLRLKKLRVVKAKAEEAAEVFRGRYQSALRLAASHIQDHQNYAASCLRLYEGALAIIDRHIAKHRGDQKWITHICHRCGPRPIIDFGVRVLPSGNLGFNPYCKECGNAKAQNYKKSKRMSIKEMAEGLVDKNLGLCQRLEEEVDEAVAS